MAKTGRNDPCPCGSGKKYKKCCLAKIVVNISTENAIKKRLVQELFKFFKKYYDADLYEDAFSFFWDGTDPEEYLAPATFNWTQMNFHEWLIFDFILDYESDNEETLIDAFLERNKRLSEGEITVLKRMRDSVISLYEVQEVFIDQGLRLKDLIRGGEYYVEEKSSTHSLRKWDIYGTRLMQLDGKQIMTGSVYPYSISRKGWMLDWIKKDYEYFKEEFPKRGLNDYLKTGSDIFNFFWYDPIANPQDVRLENKSGDAILMSKAFFTIVDKKKVMTGLKKIKGFEQESDGVFVWLSGHEADGSATLFGKVLIKDRLTLETNSKERLETGKAIIEKALGKSIKHTADTFEDMTQMSGSLRESADGKPGDELPLEIRQEFYEKFMRTHCEKWLNDSIPALNGKTPMQSVKTKAGKKRVIELLKMFENSEEHNKRSSEPHVDLSWMWERLGLARE